MRRPLSENWGRTMLYELYKELDNELFHIRGFVYSSLSGLSNWCITPLSFKIWCSPCSTNSCNPVKSKSICCRHSTAMWNATLSWSCLYTNVTLVLVIVIFPFFRLWADHCNVLFWMTSSFNLSTIVRLLWTTLSSLISRFISMTTSPVFKGSELSIS